MSQHSRVHPRPCSAPAPPLCREQSLPSVQMEGQATGPSKHQGEMSPKPGLTGGWSKCWEAHLGDCCPQPQARNLPSADLAALAPWHFPSSPPPSQHPGLDLTGQEEHAARRAFREAEAPCAVTAHESSVSPTAADTPWRGY